jgi:hypothetical protein
MAFFGQSTGRNPALLPFGTSARASPTIRTAPTPSAGEPASVTGVPTRSARRSGPRCRTDLPVCRLPGPVEFQRAPGLPAEADPVELRMDLPVRRLPGSVELQEPSVCRLPGSVELQTPFTLTRLPVPSHLRRLPVRVGSWGAVVDRFGASPLRPAGCPALRHFEACVASRPVRPRFRLVDPARRRPPPIRRSVSNDPVSWSRSACAARYEEYFRERKTPGQEVFSNPQGYPLNFSPIPRISCVVHRPCTGSGRVFPIVVHRVRR